MNHDLPPTGEPDYQDPLFAFSSELDAEIDPQADVHAASSEAESTLDDKHGSGHEAVELDKSRLRRVAAWLRAWGTATPEVDTEVFRKLVIAATEEVDDASSRRFDTILEDWGRTEIQVNPGDFRDRVLGRLLAEEDAEKNTKRLPWWRASRIGAPLAAAAVLGFAFLSGFVGNVFTGFGHQPGNVVVYATNSSLSERRELSNETGAARNTVSYVMHDSSDESLAGRVSIVTVRSDLPVTSEVPPL